MYKPAQEYTVALKCKLPPLISQDGILVTKEEICGIN